MLALEPVIDAAAATGFTLWPVAIPAPATMLRLSASMSTPQIGAAMATLVSYGHGDTGDGPRDVAAGLRAVIEAECLIAPGGLLARDTETGVVIPPSCCCGLEGWREWVSVPNGGQPWLGHSPAPWIEHLDGAVRVWPDGGLGEDRPPADGAIIAPLEVVTVQLRSAHRDLLAFLDAAGQWAHDLAPGMASDLAAKLDESFVITGHLEPSPRNTS